MATVAQAEQYARNVLDGKIVACKWVKLACQRHFNDLENGHLRGLYFDEEEAQIALDFFGLLRHSKGKWAGQPIELEPWQAFIIASVFGWYRADDTRRFRIAYEEIARKNGKSTKLSGVGLYGLVADGEGGPEIYAAATKRDQAKITFDEAVRMRGKSPPLRKRIRSVKNNLHIPETAGKFEPLGADADSLDGLNVHIGLVDELHAHKTSALWDVLESATGAREQPLMWAITTAGFNKNGFCFEQRNYAIKVLEGIIQNDEFFAIIFTLDSEEEWEDETCWIKANPNLGVSVKLETLRAKFQKAKEMPSAKNNFLTKYLNMWVNSAEAWINLDKFKACTRPFELSELIGVRLFGGLDLASTSDIAALVLIGMLDDRLMIKPFFFLPEETAEERQKKDSIPYLDWAEKGHIILTPGNICDYNFIKAKFKELQETIQIAKTGFDRWNSSQLVIDLQEDGACLEQVGQGFQTMNPAMREFERLYLSEQIWHDGNPVLLWMASNLMVAKDPAGNMKPDRKNSMEKIDGMAAIFDAIAVMMADDGPTDSVYEERGMRQI